MLPNKPELPIIFTIGHSRHSLADFLEILQAYKITRVVDVRKIPRSRHNPQFNSDSFPQSLAAEKIAYTHLPGLGGLRHPRPDSTNTAWRNPSFRAYADYMQTSEFAENIAHLTTLADQGPIAILCAEAVPWRCHRSLIADALVARGYTVIHIMTATTSLPHRPHVLS